MKITSPDASSGVSAAPSGLRILLGVTGGIAAYKAAELARAFGRAGCEVQVVMTDSALRFVGAQTFQALTGRTVRSSLWDEQAEAAMGHIELARWPDAIVVAPASANTLAKLAHGFADDLLSTLVLASDRPVFVAPAMNRLMWANAATQANVAALRARGVVVIGPGSGEQACGEIGEGRMSEPVGIAGEVLEKLGPGAGGRGPGKVDAEVVPVRPPTPALTNVKVVVTAGPTREPIDPVRFITNRSSGKQGYAVAAALAALGADVTLVSGPTMLPIPAGVTRIDVETAQQMLDATLSALKGAQLLVGTAAVADYRPRDAAPQKIKKKDESLDLAMTRNADILVEARAAHPDLFICGFAAETEKLAEHAQGKLARKKLDMIAANWVGGGRAFDQDDNALQVYWNGGEQALAAAGKAELARELAELIADRYESRVTPKPKTNKTR